jgi:hypothetical protein
VHLRVSQRKCDRGPSRNPLARALKHRRRYVNAEHVPGRAREFGELEQRLSAPAPHVEDTLACDDAHALDRHPPQRIDEGVSTLLHPHPCLAGSFNEGLARALGIGKAHRNEVAL